MEDTFVGYQLLEHHIFLFNSGGTPICLHIWDLAQYDRWRDLIWERICEDLAEKVFISSKLTNIPIIVKEHLAQDTTYSFTLFPSRSFSCTILSFSPSINPRNKLSINLPFMHNTTFFGGSLFKKCSNLRFLII